MKRIADCKRVSEQSGIQTTGSSATGVVILPASSIFRDAERLGVDAGALYRHTERMRKLRSAALTGTATAYGGSPAGCAL
jgi:hypothetical protein